MAPFLCQAMLTYPSWQHQCLHLSGVPYANTIIIGPSSVPAEQSHGALKLFLYSQLLEGRSFMVLFSPSPKTIEELRGLPFSEHSSRRFCCHFSIHITLRTSNEPVPVYSCTFSSKHLTSFEYIFGNCHNLASRRMDLSKSG